MGLRIVVRRAPVRRQSEWSGNLVWLSVAVALASIAYMLFSDTGVVQIVRTRAEASRLMSEVHAAEQANRELYAEIEALRSDPRAIERIAREELMLARPGETVYLLPPLEVDPATRQGQPRESDPVGPTAPGLPLQ